MRVARVAGRGLSGAVDFGTEAGLYQERLDVPVVVCGPGSMAQGHTPDEFLEAGQLGAGEAFVVGLLRQLSRSASDTSPSVES
jgi:acetylornithine deacetylase/succinyl-diaminopimelate desuccinylase-like protein